MEIVTSTSIARGAALIDYAYSSGGRALNLSLPDAVGMVAAYLGRGEYAYAIKDELGKRLTPEIARQLFRTYELFNDRRGRGLWEEGGAADDVKFTHPLLIEAHPSVNERHERFLRSFKAS